MGHTRLVARAAALLACALAMGCGRGSDSAPRAGDGAARLNSASASTSAEADLVSAVSSAGAAAPVGLKFKLASPPRVGQPLRIELVLNQQAGLDIDSLLVSLQPGDGLAIESEHSFEFQSPAAGATQRMTVMVRPQQPGLLSLGATVLIGTATASLTRSFSIPLIAAP
jgi:hypothetical protein